MEKDIWIYRPGSTYKKLRKEIGDFDDWIFRQIPAEMKPRRRTVTTEELPTAILESPVPKALFITGSHRMVTEPSPAEEKSFSALQKLLERKDAPAVFGICYGHQLLAHLLGGIVSNRTDAPEIGFANVSFKNSPEVASDPVFGSLSGKTIPFFAVHFQHVERLPEGAVLLAQSEKERCHAFRFGEKFWGVQFHPEFPEEATRYYAAENGVPFEENRFFESSLIRDFLRCALKGSGRREFRQQA